MKVIKKRRRGRTTGVAISLGIGGLMGFDMYGKTVGIVGIGRIAKILIGILRGFGMHVLAYDVYPDMKFAKANDVEVVDLEEIYRRSDIISLHVPLTPRTRFMINRVSINKMKRGVMIINTGRGKLIHTEDLILGLRSGQISAAGLDVYEYEQNYFYERMDLYAYVEILNVSLKLLIVYLLLIAEMDKLIVYAILMLVVSFIIFAIYYLYCKRNFRECFLLSVSYYSFNFIVNIVFSFI